MTTLLADLGDLVRSRALLVMLARREIATRFVGSALGVVWLYAQPLLTVAAYYLLFDVIFQARVGEGASSRPVGTHMVAGIVPWMAFMDAVSRGMGSIIQEAGLLQKTPLPPILFPARVVLASAVTYLPLFLLLGLAYGYVVGPGAPLLALPVLALGLFALAFLLSYCLALMSAAMRDVQQVVGLLLTLGIFASPVLYPVAMFPEELRWLLWVNPMTPVILGFQDVLLDGLWPQPVVWLVIAAWLAGLALLLDRMVRNSRDQLVDWL